MKVKYIGKCNKTDSIHGVGLTWVPGQIRDVSATVAAHLLHYRDTWEQVEDDDQSKGALSNVAAADVEKQDKGENPELIDAMPTPLKPETEPLPVVDFHSMDKTALQKFADQNLTEKMDARWSEPVLRERVQRAWDKAHEDNT